MTTAIIGTGNIGSRLATRLANGGEDLVLAASTRDSAAQVADGLGDHVTAATVDEAIQQADTLVFATWLGATKALLEEHADALAGKVVIDPSNNISFDDDGNARSENPEGVSAGEQLAAILPETAHYVKAFGTVAAPELEQERAADGGRVALFYATDDEAAASRAQSLMAIGGWDAVRAGGVDRAGALEVFGELHTMGGLDGKLVNKAEAEQLV